MAIAIAEWRNARLTSRGVPHSPFLCGRSSCSGGIDLFQASDIVIYVPLELADFVKGTLSKNSKVARIFLKKLRPQGLNGAAEILDLFEGLLQLRFVLNHSVSLNMPFERSGSNRI